MRQIQLLKAFPAVLGASALAMASTPAQSADKADGDDWEFTAAVYLYGAAAEGEMESGVSIDVSFDDVLQNLDMAFMGLFEARKARWSLLVDLIYLDASTNKDATVPIPGVPGPLMPAVKLEADAELKAWFFNLLGGYRVTDTDRWNLDVVAGARYFDLDLSFDLGGNLGMQSASTDLSPSETVLDGVVGVRGQVNLGEKWFLPYYADGGTGQSDATWQAFSGLGYRFGWGDVALTYRYIKWEFGSSTDVEDFILKGPLLSAAFHF